MQSLHILGSFKEDMPARRMLKDLENYDYRLVPINPKFFGQVLSNSIVRFELDTTQPIDTIVCFLGPESVKKVLSKLMFAKLVKYPKIWLQPGAESDEVIEVIENMGFEYSTGVCIVESIIENETPLDSKPDDRFYRQHMDLVSKCSVFENFTHEENRTEIPAQEVEWCGDILDLSNSDHIIPRYIRSLNNGEETLEELALRLCK